MKKFLCIIVFLGIMFSAALASSFDASMFSDDELIEIRNIIDIELSKRYSEKDSELLKATYGDYEFSINNMQVITVDSYYKAQILVYGSFTNYGNSLSTYNDNFVLLLFQNGVALDSESRNYNKNTNVLHGGNVDIEFEFHTNDMIEPVEACIYLGCGGIAYGGEPIAKIIIPITN